MSDIRKMDIRSINTKLAECKREIFEMRMHKAVASLEKPHKKSELKRQIARLLTAMQGEKGASK